MVTLTRSSALSRELTSRISIPTICPWASNVVASSCLNLPEVDVESVIGVAVLDLHGCLPSICSINYADYQEFSLEFSKGCSEVSVFNPPERIDTPLFGRLCPLRVSDYIFYFRFADLSPSHSATRMAAVSDGFFHPSASTYLD